MSTINSTYDLQLISPENKLKYIFVSKGKNDLVKAIEYSFVQPYNGCNIYNLGFGDYDIESDTLADDVNSNNGDHYKVFDTVLSTIPIFFENYIGDYMMVRGSDSGIEFEQKCRENCRKKCGDTCKKAHQRISVYRGYVDKNYSELIVDYDFMGGTLNDQGDIIIEPYIRYKKYQSVFVSKKSLTLQSVN